MKSVSSKPVIGITTGDPKGIGPEVVAKALQDPEISSLATFKIFGPTRFHPSLPDMEAAKMALRGLEEAYAAALKREITALVTGPVNKARLRLADNRFEGHTEFFANRCHSDVCMMFVARGWRVSLVTRHLPLKDIPLKLNAVDILKTIRMTAEGIQRYFHILKPRLAVAGLNPHAGEKGLLGNEETRYILPAILQSKREGFDITGPLSPDSLFWEMTQGRFDGVIAMYHDQGLIPIKTLAFKEAVQLTLGLPFLRCSVDHGTAEAIAGQNRADPANMKAAIRLAGTLVR